MVLACCSILVLILTHRCYSCLIFACLRLYLSVARSEHVVPAPAHCFLFINRHAPETLFVSVENCVSPSIRYHIAVPCILPFNFAVIRCCFACAPCMQSCTQLIPCMTLALVLHLHKVWRCPLTKFCCVSSDLRQTLFIMDIVIPS